jgi:hypothetical protein
MTPQNWTLLIQTLGAVALAWIAYKQHQNGTEIKNVHQAVNSHNQAGIAATKEAADRAVVLATNAAENAVEAAYERGRASRDADIEAAVKRAFEHGREGVESEIAAAVERGFQHGLQQGRATGKVEA